MRKLLWLLPLMFLFTACKKETSFEGGTTTTGTAVYTLGGVGSTCTGAIVSGTYTSGVTLTAANTVTVTVNVTTIGTYAIGTTLTNGMAFTTTGVFTSTGSQTIILTGSGAPTLVGTNTLSLAIGTAACTFSVNVVAPGPPATFTIGGAGGNCTGGNVSGTYNAGTALTTSNTATIQVNVTVLGSYNITAATVNGYSFSGAGTFTTLGTQSITLTGSGIPTTAGTNTFTAGTAGCTFNVTVAAATTPATDYITCKINGTAATFNVYPAATVTTTPYTTTSISGLANTSSSESISIISASVLGQQSLGIIYVDASSNSWTGITGLTSVSVSITSQTATRATGTFSGTIKDNSGTGTNSKTVTEGKFAVPVK